MITLYTIPALWGLPSISPPCMKLETWLRMNQIPYQIGELNFAQAPKGKAPFISLQGELIGDSNLIIERLQQTEKKCLETGLSPVERGISLAFRRMLEEHTYWGLVYLRFGIKENWLLYRDMTMQVMFPGMPMAEKAIFFEHLYDVILGQLHSQGMGRHSESEICQMVKTDFQALSDFLADREFFMGDRPTTLDATAYAHVGNLIKVPFKSPMVDYALGLDNLCQHYERIDQLFFSEPDSLTQQEIEVAL